MIELEVDWAEENAVVIVMKSGVICLQSRREWFDTFLL